MCNQIATFVKASEYRRVLFLLLMVTPRFLFVPCTDIFGQKNDVPVLDTDGTQNVRITHPRLAANWLLQLPEDVGTMDTFFLVWEPISVEWKHYRDDEVGYDWVATEKWIQQAQKNIDMEGFSIHPGVQVGVRMQTSPNRIDLTLRLTNISNRKIEQVLSDGGCLQHQTERFIDNNASRTFIRTSEGLTRLSDRDRSLKIRSLYLFDPRWYLTRPLAAWEFFWGRSQLRPVSAFIASGSSDGRGAIGIGFDHSMMILQNSDGHHCMHSRPYFGDLPPGESMSRRGVILFGENVEELFTSFHALGYLPDYTPPVEK